MGFTKCTSASGSAKQQWNTPLRLESTTSPVVIYANERSRVRAKGRGLEKERIGRERRKTKSEKRTEGMEKVGDHFFFVGKKRRARTRQETDARINNGYLYLLLRLDSSPSAAIVLRGPHERQSMSRTYVVFCIAPQRGRLMAAVMQRDCPFHGALRGKTHVATGETHANDTRTCTS